ncbi:SIMPL domain-containing protein [Microbacterium sp. SORGH_AS_0888]|uniref:SIMPL domain-containing protein n=1 Tax=Microbacterium sp. SORGH_AS_0888 TaxID=3041791 RepID=UPI002784268C|nr:SIMPL domain-containing protein [Microbacterium sp. SORGH_AS_0888]MDQ1130280.1 uncharacterized protein YggE [Microbacterium sp. SORGH_AS_0888]
MTVVVTEGTAERHLVSERCTLTIRVSREAPTSEVATAGASQRVVVLAERATRLRESGQATWHQVTPVTSWLRKWRDDQGNQHSAWVAAAEVRVKLCELSLVGRLSNEMAAEGYTVTTSWALTEATRKSVQREVRIEAVRAARERAEDYAAALGGHLVDTLELSDAGEALSFGGMPRAAAAAGAGAAAAEQVTIPEQTVSARITARFDVR